MTASPDVISDPRFNQTFEVAADPENGLASPFQVKYADYGYRNEAHPEEENIVLFFGPLLGSRLVQIAKDELAKKHKIRIINPDRPGIGGTESVSVDDRMSLWRNTLRRLLQHLNIQHVSLVCHSGGTIYALDLLLHHPEVLHPDKPYLAIGGPWILPTHTGSTAMSIVQVLPASVIGQTDKLATLINNHIGPLLGQSFGVSANVVAKFMPSQPEPAAEESDDAKREDQLWQRIIEQVYTEGVQGLSTDAVLLMRKNTAGWSDWGDYDTAVPRLAETLRAGGKRLVVDVFYAEHDALIGDGGESKGARWFDGCWQSGCDDVVEYRTTTVKGADHDGIWKLRWGATQTAFERIGLAG